MLQLYIREGFLMIIQSKRIWIDNEFKEAQIEIKEGKIINIYPYNEERLSSYHFS